MSITAISLYRDTFNFLIKNLKIIIIIVFFSALISTIIDMIITPNINTISNFCVNYTTNNILETIKNMTYSQKKILLKISILRSIAYLIGNTFLFSCLILFIKNLSNKNLIDIKQSIKKIIPLIPSLFSLLLILSIIIQLGFIFFIIPGIIGSILLSLSPIILITKKKSIINSMYSSFKLTKSKIYILIPSIIIWMIIKILISIIIMTIFNTFSEQLSFLLHNIINNFISSILIIYLYRFYMLNNN